VRSNVFRLTCFSMFLANFDTTKILYACRVLSTVLIDFLRSKLAVIAASVIVTVATGNHNDVEMMSRR